MATTRLTLGFDPIWSNFNIFGVSAGGAKLYSYDSLNPTVEKFIFSDPGGNFPYTDPVIFDQNGNAPGPFYFLFDENNPKSLYDLFFYDAQGNLIWNIDSYFPGNGSGGGTVTTAIDIENLVINSVLWRNIGGGAGPTPSPVSISDIKTQIAPGAHDGLSFNVAPVATIATSNAFGPDIYLMKNTLGATETVTFQPFNLGETPFTNDVTPVEFVHHEVTGGFAGETFRYYQFPITAKVQNLTNQNVTISIWGRGVSGSAQTILMQWAQFYGDGLGATPAVITPIVTYNLTNAWAKYSTTTTVPNVATNTLGPCGNDGLFLLVSLPLTTPFSIDFAKPSLYLGTIAPGPDYINYDNIDAAVNSPRTGDIRTTLNNFGSVTNLGAFGWAPMNDGTIGSNTSGASTRAKTDTFPLYNLIWNSVLPAWAPMADGLVRGASAIADFTANRAIALTRALGRVFAGTINPSVTQALNFTLPVVPTTSIGVASSVGFSLNVPVIFTTTGTLPAPLALNTTYYANIVDATHISVSATLGGGLITITSAGTGINTVQISPHVLGQYLGAETSTGVGPHMHDIFPGGGRGAFLMEGAGAGQLASGAPGPLLGSSATTTGGVVGGGAAYSIMQPTTYMNVFIKL